MKFHEQKHDNGTRSMLFECPGCDMLHVVYVAGEGVPVWTFNGDIDKPTVSPSVLVRSNYGQPPVDTVCHSLIKDGQIQFLGDCTHKLAGQTVEIPEYED
jgi:hypothetical protein